MVRRLASVPFDGKFELSSSRFEGRVEGRRRQSLVLRVIPFEWNKRKIAPANFQEISFKAFFSGSESNLRRYSVLENRCGTTRYGDANARRLASDRFSGAARRAELFDCIDTTDFNEH